METREALDRAYALRQLHDTHRATRMRVKAILDGGRDAARALLGPHVSDEDLPWANLMLSGLTRLAQKIQHRPDIRVDPPFHREDSEAAQRRAEKVERIVESYDQIDRMELQLPQVARWILGYSFGVWVIEQGVTPDGFPYPRARLRDPADCFPGEWGASQHPEELAIWRRVFPDTLMRLYPAYEAEIRRAAGAGYPRLAGGAVLLGSGEWEGDRGRGLEVCEYYDPEGMSVVLPYGDGGGVTLERISNPLKSGPAFVIPRRFTFNKLAGHYDQIIGLMVAMTKINVYGIIAMEDAVFSPTNVYGEPPNPKYRVGRNVVNVMPPGTRVERPVSQLPYQLFEQINRIERQIRLVGGYPIQDDSQSPLSFATGAGLEELSTAVSQEVREYQTVLRHALEMLDAKRLEWDERLYGGRRKPLVGHRKGVPFAESYTPARDIRGAYRTRRVYGVMAGWDEPQKIIAGLQLLQAKVIDRRTMRENLDGLENLSRIDHRVMEDDARDALLQGLVMAVQSPDPQEKSRAIMALVELLPASKTKEALQKFYTPSEPELSPEEQAFLSPPAPAGPPPDVTTVLSRLTGSGTEGGVQTVGRL